MRWQQVHSKYRYLFNRTTLQTFLLTATLWSLYSGGLFWTSHIKHERTHTTEFGKVRQRLQNHLQHLQKMLEHLSDCVQETPDLNPRMFSAIISDIRLATPYNFPEICSLFWEWKGHVISPQPSIPQNMTLPPQRFGLWAVERQGSSLMLQKRVPKTTGRLIAEIPLSSLHVSDHFVLKDVVPEISPSTHYQVFFPALKATFVFQEAAPFLWTTFFKENLFFLLFFGVLSLGIAGGVVLGGRYLYALACQFLKEDIEEMRQHNNALQEKLWSQEQTHDLLNGRHQAFCQAAQKKEAFMSDVLTRQRLMREKAYITMSLFLERADLEDDEDGAGFWVKDMRNHFGFPNPEIFSLRSLLEQVMAVFTERAQNNQLQISIDDQMSGDVIETDRLILGVVLANVINRCILRLPKEGELHITLKRCRRSFKITFLDTGYILPNNDYVNSASRDQFFFLESDVFESLRDSLQLKLTANPKTREEMGSMNHTGIEVPFKLKPQAPELPQKRLLPANVIRMPSHRRGRPTEELS